MTPPSEFNTEFRSRPRGAGATEVDALRLLRSRWKQIAVGVMLGALLGVVAYLGLGPVYSATTQVLVSKRASTADGEGMLQLSGGRTEHVQLIQTDLIVAEAFRRHGLDRIPELSGARDPLKEVTEGLKVTRSAGQEHSFDNILNITYLHSNKEVARKVVQALVDAYRDYLVDTREENSRSLRESLSERQRQLEGEVRRLEAELKQFRREAPVYISSSPAVSAEGSAPGAPNQQESTLLLIQTARGENRRRRAALQARLSTLDRMAQDSTVSREELEYWVVQELPPGEENGGSVHAAGESPPAGHPARAQLDQQLMNARLLEQRLLLSLGEDHSAVRNVRLQIETILTFYRQQGLRPPANGGTRDVPAREAAVGVDLVEVHRRMLRQQFHELELDDGYLERQYQEALAKAKEASLVEVEDQRRKDEIAQKKQQLKQLHDTMAAFDISEEQEGYRLRQISQVRTERSLKRVAKIVGAFGLFGGAMIFGAYWWREWRDPSLKSLDQVRTLTAGEILGSIPLFGEPPQQEPTGFATAVSSSLCFLQRPASREAEAFRAVRTALLLKMEGGRGVVQVSSPEPEDGKSTVAGNLAAALAQSGKRVLLIDGDLRRPQQHALLGHANEVGLADALAGEIEWQNAVQQTALEGLLLLTAGSCTENPAELLSGSRLPQILKEARSSFDLLVLDSPPVLPVSDACIVSPHADGMLLVVRMARSSRTAVARTREVLEAHGVQLHGIVVNGLSPESADLYGERAVSYGGQHAESKTGDPDSKSPRSGQKPFVLGRV